MGLTSLPLEPSHRSPVPWAPFALAFRPFFLLAGVAAVALMGVWLAALSGLPVDDRYYHGIGWHSHEMLFGYSAAVVAGFLLTAVRNWTGVQTLRHTPLALLALIWLLGRLLPFIPAVPPLWVAVVDTSFLPLVAAAVAHPVLRVRQWNNLIFVPLLLAYAVANLLVHLQRLGVLPDAAVQGRLLGLGMVLLLVVVMGGRVIGFFIERGIPGAQVRRWPWVERLAAPSIVIFVAASMLGLDERALAALAMATAVLHGLRLFGWYAKGVWSVSLLWVLYLGYAWLAIGFLLQAFSLVGALPATTALHAFTAGAIGSMTLGMMARVSLGHTGREMKVPGVITAAFALIVLAGLARVALPILLPQHTGGALAVSALLWIAAFAPFCWRYVPMLLRARVDGQPG